MAEIEKSSTRWLSTVEVLPAKFEVPAKTAVIECVPEESADVVNVAWELAFNVPVPRAAMPSINVTVPPAVPVPLGVTVAEKVTDCPATDGFLDDATEVLVATLLTVWLKVPDMLPAKFPSPL